jgi:predicted metal-dependent hydrolase
MPNSNQNFMSSKLHYINTIGDVSFVKNNRSKSLRITVKPNEGVKVTIPAYVSFSNAFRFVEEKKDWIRHSLEKMKSLEQSNTIFKPGCDFSTRFHKLEFIHEPENLLRAKVGKGFIRIFYPSENVVLSKEGQEMIRKAIEFGLRKEAKEFLPQRVMELAVKFRITYTSVYVKNLKSRWGSCSSLNNINLNIHLMRLPDHLIDYVILHELTHIVHKNHGPKFWLTLENLSGNAKLFAREMKKYRTRVY